MGRIKSTLIKRTARQIIEKNPTLFSSTFSENTKILGRTMPSKRMRNSIAGYITRIKKNTHKIIETPELH
ncbi:MAG: 30S ribosomal protein S17e [Nanoarchaeota archaeon]|nr:30S ribosomal protein S17e [Nanoarchaeota archaeon]